MDVHITVTGLFLGASLKFRNKHCLLATVSPNVTVLSKKEKTTVLYVVACSLMTSVQCSRSGKPLGFLRCYFARFVWTRWRAFFCIGKLIQILLSRTGIRVGGLKILFPCPWNRDKFLRERTLWPMQTSLVFNFFHFEFNRRHNLRFGS